MPGLVPDPLGAAAHPVHAPGGSQPGHAAGSRSAAAAFSRLRRLRPRTFPICRPHRVTGSRGQAHRRALAPPAACSLTGDERQLRSGLLGASPAAAGAGGGLARGLGGERPHAARGQRWEVSPQAVGGDAVQEQCPGAKPWVLQPPPELRGGG